MAHSQAVQSLQRGLDLVELVVDAPGGLTLQELSERVGLKATTVFNLARTLVDRGYLSKSIGRPVLYRSGAALDALAGRVAKRKPPPFVGSLERLAADHPQWKFLIAQSEGVEVMACYVANPRTAKVSRESEPRRLAPYTTASSLCHQAFWPRDRIAELEREYPFDLYGVGFWGSASKLKESLAAFRREGMAQVLDRRPARMAAPLYTVHGELAGSIGASCVAGRRPSLQACQTVAQELLSASQKLGENLERVPALLLKAPQPLNV